MLATLNNGQNADQKLRDVYVKVVQEQLPSVLDNLREYTRVMGRMYEKQGKQNAGNISQLVEAQGGSFTEAGTNIIGVRDIKFFIAASLLAAMIGLFYGFFSSATRLK